MTPKPASGLVLISEGAYRLLLNLYPRRFRDEWGLHMSRTFRDHTRQQYEHNGILGLFGLWMFTTMNVVQTALEERAQSGEWFMSKDMMIRIGCVASAFGGLCWWMMVIAPYSGVPAMILALVLGLGGLVGLYSRLAGQAGRLGLAGLVLGTMGTLVTLAAMVWGVTSGRLTPSTIRGEPVLAAPVALIIVLAEMTLGIGLALLGVASLRAAPLPQWRGLPLGLGLVYILFGIVSGLTLYVPLSQGDNPFDPWNPGMLFLGFMLWGTGWLVLGTMLASEADAKVAQSPPASA